ncbi:MAG: carbohydrate ABC transporter permease [Clostridia bacterium]|nr:carbohydrate ABC transporter permease [Clostridia bacterium]
MAENKRGKMIAFLFLIILGVCWFEPIVWLITNSFKFDADFITSFANITGPWDYLTRLIPKTWTISNYTELFFGGENVNTNANIGLMFQNSFIVSITVTVCTVFITSLSAFAYERLEFKGGEKIFWTLMYMSMFPNVVAILPQFRIANALGWVNNLNALIWPMLAGVFNIFMIRNFMKSIPKALDEAATIDGASSFQVYTKIILPSIMPVMIVVGLFAFNGAWNDYLWPRIVMTDVNNQTLTAGLRLLMGQYEQRWAHMIASCLVSMVPPFVLYLCAQKYFLQGISVQAGVKG